MKTTNIDRINAWLEEHPYATYFIAAIWAASCCVAVIWLMDKFYGAS